MSSSQSNNNNTPSVVIIPECPPNQRYVHAQLPRGPFNINWNVVTNNEDGRAEIVVTSVVNPSSPLKVNDVIVSVNGYSLADILALPTEQRQRELHVLIKVVTPQIKNIMVRRVRSVDNNVDDNSSSDPLTSGALVETTLGDGTTVFAPPSVLEQLGEGLGGLDLNKIREQSYTFDEVPEYASLEEYLVWVSKHICKTDTLRPLQMDALLHLLDPNKGKLLLVTRTGSGKSHVMRMLGVMMGGVIVIIVPLLSLSADQMEKMTSISQQTGPMGTVHCDEMPSEPGTLDPLIERIQQLDEKTSSTIFLLTSPQFLAKKSSAPLREALFEAHSKGNLRGVVVDELHLFVQHSAFRPAIPMLKELFFEKIFPADDPESHPPALFMSATMTPRFVEIAEELTTIKLPNKCRLWPDREHFAQRDVEIKYTTTNNFTGELNHLVGILTNSIRGEEHGRDEVVVVFTTTAKKATDLHSKLNEKLDKVLDSSDVVLVHGDMHKMKKFYGFYLFGNKIKFKHFNPRALVTNGAGNTGIDHPYIVMILRAGLPMDLPTAFQEKGRLVREPGMSGCIHYLCNVESLLQILHLIYKPSHKSRNDMPEEIRGANSAIRHGLERVIGGASPFDDDDDVSEEDKKRTLTPEQLAAWRKDRLAMLLDVMKFFFLDLGCLHVRAENFMATGELRSAPSTIERCGSKCPICTRGWHKQHKPIRSQRVIEWFQHADFTDNMPLSTKSTPQSLTNLLWNGKPSWFKLIFGVEKNSIKKYNVECMMESLIAAEIITHKNKQLSDGSYDIQWHLNRVITTTESDGDSVQTERPCYEIDSYWSGINLR